MPAWLEWLQAQRLTRAAVTEDGDAALARA
jgi:hypothetical protein